MRICCYFMSVGQLRYKTGSAVPIFLTEIVDAASLFKYGGRNSGRSQPGEDAYIYGQTGYPYGIMAGNGNK